MQEIVNQKRYDDSVTYQILGGERQTLQIVLMPGQSIVTKKSAILYLSDNITTTNLNNSYVSRCINWMSCRRDEDVSIELRNESGGIGYVGLQTMKGRVIIIDNEVSEKMIVKDKYVLARTSNVALVPQVKQVWNQSDNRSAGLSQIKSMKIDLKGSNKTASELIKEANEKTLAEQYKDLIKPSQELVFLQGQSNFIEKTLGANEKMKIRPECIVAFSPTISIQSEVGTFDYFSSSGKFVNVTGPGLLYIDMQQGKRFFKKDQLSLIGIVLYFCLYSIVLLVLTFNRSSNYQDEIGDASLNIN